MRLVKVIYALILLIIAVILFVTANRLYGYGSALISFIAAIYVIFMKRVVKGKIEKIYITSSDIENHGTNIVALQSDDFECIKQIFESKYMVLSLNRDYVLDNNFLSIKSERKTTDLFYGVDSEGKCVVKSKNKFFEVEVSDHELEVISSVLRKYRAE